MPNTKYVLQRKLYAFLVWDLYSTNTGTLNAEWMPPDNLQQSVEW